MGFLQGLGKFFGSIIFTTFLVLAILLIEIVSFTSYDNFKSVVGGIFENQLFSRLSDQDLTDLRTLLVFQCSQTDKVTVPLGGAQQIVMECTDVKNVDNVKLKSLIMTSLVDSFYYKKFDCSFIDCIKTGNLENLLIVASNEGNQFYRSLQIYMWIGAGVGLVLLLVSTATWVGRLKGVGWNLVFTGLPFVILGYFQSKLIPSLPSEIASSVMPIINDLFSSLNSKFMIVLVTGIILLVAGYALGFYLSRRSGKKKK